MVATAIAFAVCAPSSAAAQATSGAEHRAQVAFEAGRTAYREGRYDDALEDFTRAHDLSDRPELLYNIGLAADRLRHDADAIAAFEGYLDALPEAENRAEVESRLRALREAVAADAAAREAEVDAARGSIDAPASTELYEEWWFWTAIGGAIVLAIVIPVGVVAGSRTETAPFVTGDVGPGGIVIALDGP